MNNADLAKEKIETALNRIDAACGDLDESVFYLGKANITSVRVAEFAHALTGLHVALRKHIDHLKI